ncbi:MAG: sensor domain-containing diguanylate cyclase [Pseudomonas sp.]|uniref:sensor domain-containing diguanylate cyclase n=1 Tax=Pseudomonas sp. TaxID=306 RepID=UPI002733EFDA|nr:sensor domain-containing diguanylate cyclase [Pseudomonas sp.]MDP3847760.1 sensor domain-containing diguanylate cyclase [Pseudomonas sp.]
MQELQLIHAKLDLLRHGAVEFAQLHKHVGELEQLTAAMDASNSELFDELNKARQQIRQWQNFFDLSLDMLCIAHTGGYFLDVNPSFMRVLGYAKEELLQRPFIDFVHPDDVAATLGVLATLIAGGDTINFENRYRCKDGHYAWLAWCTPAPAADSSLLYAIARDITERKRSDAEILHQAAHDSLTGLFNRAALMQQVQLACARFRRDARQNFALLFLDLDHFKPINDSYGHQCGDELLRQVAERLRHCCRDGDIVARLGGDEFIILAADQSATQPQELKVRLQAALQVPFAIAEQRLQIGASIGIAQPGITEPNMDVLLEHADRQMYLDKLARRPSLLPTRLGAAE